jgi:hypothetical protein
MKTNRAKKLLVLCTLLLVPFSALAQSSSLDLRFSGHTLGEPADVFFLTARTLESKQLTKDYCKSLLDDPKSKSIPDDPKTKGSAQLYDGVTLFRSNPGDRYPYWEVPDCRQAMAALKGDQARVRGNLASELKGAALFASGRLSAFNLRVDSSYADAVADMERRFGAPGQKDTVSRVGWPTPLQEFRWERDGILAAVWNNEFSNGTVVIIGFLESPYESFLRGTPCAREKC